MIVIQIAPMEGTSYHLVQSQSHRESCWLEGYIAVPEQLEEKVNACVGHCDLVVEGAVLKDILPIPLPMPTPTASSAEDDNVAMLVDHEYRLTLMELGVSE